MDHPLDLRRMFGSDVRRVQWTSEDRARAEGLVARYGGVIETRPNADHTVAVQWMDPTGQTVLVQAETLGEGLSVISQVLVDDETTYIH